VAVQRRHIDPVGHQAASGDGCWRAAKRRRRRLFRTTKTEKRVIVAVATRGLRKPSAASEMARVL